MFGVSAVYTAKSVIISGRKGIPASTYTEIRCKDTKII